MRAYRGVFTDRTARALFLSAAVSGLGDWIGLAGLVVLAYQRTGTPLGPGALLACQGVAAVVAVLVLGPQLDRIDRRTGLAVAYGIGAVALVLPLVAPGLWPILVTASMVGALRPSAAALRHAVAGSDLAPDLLGPTMALQKVVGDVTVAVGLALGGVVAVLVGPVPSLLLDSATFVLAAALALGLPHGRGVIEGRSSPWDGYRLWLTDRRLLAFMVVLLALAAVSSIPETLAAAVAGSGPWLPAVISAQAVGSAVAGVALGHRRDLERTLPLVGGMALVALALAGAAGAAAWDPAALALANFVLGLPLGIMVIAQIGFTRTAPRERLGAVVSSAITASMAAEGLGALGVGALAGRFGAPAGYLAAAAAVGVACLAALAAFTRSSRGPGDGSQAVAATAPAPRRGGVAQDAGLVQEATR